MSMKNVTQGRQRRIVKRRLRALKKKYIRGLSDQKHMKSRSAFFDAFRKVQAVTQLIWDDPFTWRLLRDPVGLGATMGNSAESLKEELYQMKFIEGIVNEGFATPVRLVLGNHATGK